MFSRKEEALNRPKTHFVPKTLADLNIDTLSITSAGSDTNSNFGGRFHNNSLIKSKANVYASQQNLSTHKSSISSSSSVQTFSRSKVYGSQQSLQSNGQRPSVNNNNQSMDAWMNAWDDQNNNPAPSAPSAATYSQRSFNNNVNLYNNSNNPNRNSFKKPMSIHNHSSGQQAFSSQNRQVDLFNDDPVWSGDMQHFFSTIFLCPLEWRFIAWFRALVHIFLI